MHAPTSPSINKSTLAPQRVFIDVSHTICSGKNAGIERVVRSLTREALSSDIGPTPELVIGDENGFYTIGDHELDRFRSLVAMQANVADLLPRWYLYPAKRLCNLTRSSHLQSWLAPSAGHLGLLKAPHRWAQKRIRKRVARSPKVAFSGSDLLILPDAYWAKNDVWQAASQARSAGATIASIAYDLIPITHPQLLGDKPNDGFVNYVHQLGRTSDIIVAISNHVKEQLEAYLPALLPNESFCTDIRSFRLGSDLSTKDEQANRKVQPKEKAKHSESGCYTTDTRGPVINLFQQPGIHQDKSEKCSNVYLMVGTFEPRKNHRYLLSAFDEIWKTLPDLQLCLVGHKGWQCNQLLDELAAHPKRSTNLFVFHDLADVELQYCYQHCRAVVMPSIVEGFGLPIVEALRYGATTFASDIPVHREVGSDHCIYFDLSSSSDLASQIMAFETGQLDFQPPVHMQHASTWAQSTEQLLQTCFSAHSQSRKYAA